VVDPTKLRAYGIPLSKITDAIRASNMDVGGRVIEMSEREYMVRVGYLRGVSDIEGSFSRASAARRCACTTWRGSSWPDERRGLTELNGEGEVVSGIVLQRDGKTRSGNQAHQGEDRRNRRRPAGRRQDRAGLHRSASFTRHRHAQAYLAGGERDRRAVCVIFSSRAARLSLSLCSL